MAGSERLEEELGGMRVRISGEAFFQTNTEMAEQLYAIATDYAAPRADSTVSTTSTAESARSAC